MTDCLEVAVLAERAQTPAAPGVVRRDGLLVMYMNPAYPVPQQGVRKRCQAFVTTRFRAQLSQTSVCSLEPRVIA